MYAGEYGTDWSGIDADEAIERAYALGVAATLGETHPGELERLQDAVGTADDRALVQLAFDKGRSRGRTARIEADDREEAWTSVVNEDERRQVTVSSQQLPAALRRLPVLRSRAPDDGLDRIRLPAFLTRR